MHISQTKPTLMFVYGTLRPGCSEWARDGYAADPIPGTTPGALLDYGPFPYADFDGEGTIKGEILTLEPWMAEHVAEVEEGAGYDPRIVVVDTADGPVQAYGWHITDKVRNSRYTTLEVIPSGDWLVAQTEKYGASFGRRRSYR